MDYMDLADSNPRNRWLYTKCAAAHLIYAHFAASHASRSILEAQRLEHEELAGDKRATPEAEQESKNTRVPANL